MKFMMLFKDTPKNLIMLQNDFIGRRLCGAKAEKIWQGEILDENGRPVDNFLALCFHGTMLNYILMKVRCGKYADVMKGWPSDYEKIKV